MKRELYDLDLWIRQRLRETSSPEMVLRDLETYLALNAVEMGFMQHADGSWRWAGEWVWGPGVYVTVEQVPLAEAER